MCFKGNVFRQIRKREEFDFGGVVAGAKLASYDLAFVYDEHGLVPRVVAAGVHAEKPGESDIQIGLFLEFTNGRFLYGFAVFHETCGQRPHACPWLKFSLDQKYIAPSAQNYAGRGHRILVENEPTLRANQPDSPMVIFFLQPGAAPWAKFEIFGILSDLGGTNRI